MMQQVAASHPKIAAVLADDSSQTADAGQADIFREQLSLEQGKGQHSIEPVRKGGHEKPAPEVVDRQGKALPDAKGGSTKDAADATKDKADTIGSENHPVESQDKQSDPTMAAVSAPQSTQATDDELSRLASMSTDVEAQQQSISEGEQQADDWLTLVYQLVLGQQTSQDGAPVAAEEDGLKAEQVNTKADAQGLENDQAWTEENLALLQQLGLNPDVLQEMLTPEQLSDFKAFLADMAQEPELQMFASAIVKLGEIMGGSEAPKVPAELFTAKGWEGLLRLESKNLSGGISQEQIASLAQMTDDEKVALLNTKVQDGMMSLSQLQAIVQASEEPKSLKGQAVGVTDERVKQVSPAPVVTALKHESDKAPTPEKSVTLQELVQLPEKELDKKLTQLAEQLPVKQQGPEAVRDFVASLKAGMAEFKAQLQQGREPGLDLQSLVQSSLKEQGIQLPPATLQPELQRFASLLETQPLGRQEAFDPSIRGLAERQIQVETTQVQSETAKAATSTQHSALDKAINIAKPEAAVQLAERVRMLVNLGNMSADIRLDPPELGSMQVRVHMHGEQASVNFVVQSQQARDMLDQAVPRLREMLAEKGIELGQSFVQQEGKGQQFADQQNQSGMGSEAEAAAEAVETELRVVNGRVGGIDYFV